MCDVQSYRAGGHAGDVRTIADWRGDRRVGAGTEWEYRAYDRYCQAVIASHFHAGGLRGNSGCGFDGGYAKALEGYDFGVDAVVGSSAVGAFADGGRLLGSRDGSDGCDFERDGGERVGEFSGAVASDCDRRADVGQLECGDVSGGRGDAASVGGCSDDVRCGSSRPGELVSDSVESKAGCSGDVNGVDSCANVVRGKHYESNRRKRLQRKMNKLRSIESSNWRKRDGDDKLVDLDGQDQNVPTFREFVEARAESEVRDDRLRGLEARVAEEAAARSARQTLAEKWSAENKLATLKAEQAYKLLQSKDLELEAKKRSSFSRMQHERNMVNMEKAHQYLKVTGNVQGFAQTVLSDEGLTDGSSASPVSPGECTISPDSSASMKEFRELVKKNADLEAKLEQFHKMTKIHPDYIELYKKQTWTINSENIRILDEMYPQGHALNPIPDYENYDAPTHGELIVGRDEEYFPY